MDTPKPIGYWLKHLDGLLERHFTLVLSDLGVSHRQWQLLNLLSASPRTRDDLERGLAPFRTTAGPDLGEALEDLTARTWVTDSAGTIALTSHGVAAHAELARRIDHIRTVVVGGLRPEQYVETVRILSVMANNVEADIATRGRNPART